MLSNIDMNSSYYSKLPYQSCLPSCCYLNEMIILSQKAKQLEYDFDIFQKTSNQEKAFLQRQIYQLSMEKNAHFSHVLVRSMSPQPIRQSIMPMQITPYTDILLEEKNVEITSLRQKLTEMLDANRRLNILIESKAFAIENEKSAFGLSLKEKDLMIQRLKNDLDRSNDVNFKQNSTQKHLIEELTSDNSGLRLKIDQCHAKLIAKDGEIHKENEKSKNIIETELIQTRNIFGNRLKSKIQLTTDNLLGLIDFEKEKNIKKTALKFWMCKYQSKKAIEDLREVQKTNGVNKITSKIRQITIFLSEETINCLYRVFHRSVIAANKQKVNSFGLFIKNFKESFKNGNTYKKTLTRSFYELNELLAKFNPEEKLLCRTSELPPIEFDKFNQVILNNLVEIESKAQKKVGSLKNEENEHFLTVYHLFMILYRAEYPISAEKVEIRPEIREVITSLIFCQLQLMLK